MVRLNNFLEPQVLLREIAHSTEYVLPDAPATRTIQEALEHTFGDIDLAQYPVKGAVARLDGHTFQTIVGEALPAPADPSMEWVYLGEALDSHEASVSYLRKLDTNWRALLLDHGLPKAMGFQEKAEYFTVLMVYPTLHCDDGKGVQDSVNILLHREPGQEFTLPSVSHLAEIYQVATDMSRIGTMDVGGVPIDFYRAASVAVPDSGPFKWFRAKELATEPSKLVTEPAIFAGTRALPQWVDFKHLIGSLLSEEQLKELVRQFWNKVRILCTALPKNPGSDQEQAMAMQEFVQGFSRTCKEESENLAIAVDALGLPWFSLDPIVTNNVFAHFVSKVKDVSQLEIVFSEPLLLAGIPFFLKRLLYQHEKACSNPTSDKVLDYLVSKIDKNLLWTSYLDWHKAKGMYYAQCKEALATACRVGYIPVVEALHRYPLSNIKDCYYDGMLSGHKAVLEFFWEHHAAEDLPTLEDILGLLSDHRAWESMMKNVPNTALLDSNSKSILPDSWESFAKSPTADTVSRAMKELVDCSERAKVEYFVQLSTLFKRIQSAVEFTLSKCQAGMSPTPQIT